MLKWDRIRVELGEWLRLKRVNLDLAQSYVMKETRCGHSQFLSNIERGLAGPPPKFMKQLLKLYKIDKEEFVQFMLKKIEAEFRREYLSKKISSEAEASDK